MRILVINSEFPPIGGGAGNASLNISECMAAAGHEVTVLTSNFKGMPGLDKQGGVRIVRASAIRKRIDRSNAFEQVTFILGGSLSALKIAIRRKPDVVLAFFGMPSGAIALALKLFFNIPYIVSLRGGDVPGFRPYDFAVYHKIISPFLRLVWRSAGAVVANSSGLRAMGEEFEPNVPIKVIPNGVDAEVYSPGDRDWELPRLLFVGRVVYQKGIDILLQALGNLKDLPWELTIVGDGPERAALEALTKALEIRDRVKFAGWLHDDALLDAYRWANLFTYASRHEGMPNAVLEAMACGLPVLATRIAGNEELVIHKKTGILVEPEDGQAFKFALHHLLQDAEARRQLGEAARRRVVGHYPWSRAAGNYVELLERISHD